MLIVIDLNTNVMRVADLVLTGFAKVSDNASWACYQGVGSWDLEGTVWRLRRRLGTPRVRTLIALSCVSFHTFRNAALSLYLDILHVCVQDCSCWLDMIGDIRHRADSQWRIHEEVGGGSNPPPIRHCRQRVTNLVSTGHLSGLYIMKYTDFSVRKLPLIHYKIHRSQCQNIARSADIHTLDPNSN